MKTLSTANARKQNELRDDAPEDAQCDRNTRQAPEAKCVPTVGGRI